MVRTGKSVPSPVRTKAPHALGALAFGQGDNAVTRSSLKQSLEATEEAAARRGMRS